MQQSSFAAKFPGRLLALHVDSIPDSHDVMLLLASCRSEVGLATHRRQAARVNAMRILNSMLSKLSRAYMNHSPSYDEHYYLMNHIRHVDSYYGFIIRAYYRYVAGYGMASPADLAKGSSVLDVGCGIGILVDQFNKLGYQACGVDVSPEAIRNSMAAEHCMLVSSTALLAYPDQHFDLVASREVLEHIPRDEIDDCIAEWDRVGNGLMIHIIAVKERGPSATEDPTHVNVQDESWWIDRFESHGYRAIARPKKCFFSPFGNSGYFMFAKDKSL